MTLPSSPPDSLPGSGALPLSGAFAPRSSVIVGTEGPDSIAGTPGPDRIEGLGGNDRPPGGAGGGQLRVEGTGFPRSAFGTATGQAATLVTPAGARRCRLGTPPSALCRQEISASQGVVAAHAGPTP